jgi:hypothetical protein
LHPAPDAHISVGPGSVDPHVGVLFNQRDRPGGPLLTRLCSPLVGKGVKLLTLMESFSLVQISYCHLLEDRV